ncbi:acyltransferase family protein [Microbacterium sp. CJ88]|uniref:acyltransferase family protein n=1 Tax=Microbacterium sp. CJ88 TaxID=3445672 RepID=UPI003F65B1C2
MPRDPAARISGLDGLRALAVALVVVYHLFPGWLLKGGFVGVDVFFVISGFLITTLLLREREASGRIGLRRFWQRRARRLLPALAVLVTVCSTAAWALGGDVLVRLGEQVLGAATFSYNWVSIAGGSGYFSATAPELFRNLWSLAVEEQFYVLWPLLMPLFLLLPRAWGRTAAAVLLAGVSAAWTTVLATSGADLTRVYFGTDTHAFGLLLGVGLAFGLQRLLTAPPAWAGRGVVRTGAAIAGAGAVAGLVAVSTVAPSLTAWTFPGATGAASVLSAVAIACAVLPGSWFGRAVDTMPLRWVGDRSYGIYLWHWPLLVLLMAATGHGAGGAVPLEVGATALALTLVMAELSYRGVERPVRRHGFRGALALLRGRVAGPPLARLGALIAIAAAAVALGGTSAAIALAPDVSSGQSAIEAGAAALGEASDPPADGSTDASSPSPLEASGAPTPGPSPTLVTGDEITAVGDSVMLASAPALLSRYPGIEVDAAVSRSMWAGPDILRGLADSGRLRPFVVIGLGTNGPIDVATLDEITRICGPDRQVVLVNAFAPRDWIPGVNAELATFADARPGVQLADWSGAIAPHKDLLAQDDIHPGDAGGRIFADAVATAVDDVEAERAQRAHDRDLLRARWEPRLTAGG